MYKRLPHVGDVGVWKSTGEGLPFGLCQDDGGGSAPSGGSRKMGKGGLPQQTGTVDMVGQCGKEKFQLEGNMGNGSKTPELCSQSSLRRPPNTNQSPAVFR